MPNIKAGGITARINVNTVDARANINQLKRSVRQLNTRFKDTYRSQLMAGHAQDALETKNRGAKEQYDALSYSIEKVNNAIHKAQRLHETGTKNYHAAELDLQNMVEWQKREGYIIEHTNHLMTLHNDGLRNSIEVQRHDMEVGRQRLDQYRAEGNEVKANNQIYENRKQKIKDLQHVIQQYAITERNAHNEGIDNTGNKDYDRIVEGKEKAVQALSQLRREIYLDDSQLKQMNSEADRSRETSQTLIQGYNAENRSVAANVERIKDRANKLRQINKMVAEAQRDVQNAQTGHYGNSEYVNRLNDKIRKLGTAAKETKAELHDLNNSLSSGRRYDELYNQSTNSLVNALKEIRGKAQASRVEYQRLTDNIQHEGEQLVKQEAEVKRVAAANRTQNDTTGHASLAYQRENAKLMALNATYSRHRESIEELSKSYGDFSLHSARSIDNLTDKIKTNDLASHKWLTTAHGMTNGSIALGAAFYYGSKQAVGLNNEFNKISVLARNNNESISQVRQNVRGMTSDTVNLSEKYGVSQQKISNGLETLIRRGYSSGQALHSMKYYLQASTASGEDLTDVIHTAGSTLEGFGLKSGNIGKNTKVVTNEMAAAADYTASSFHDMGVAMAYTGPIAKSTNQSVSETSSALGELANKGIKGSMAGTSLRRILQDIAGFKPNNKVLQSMGLSSKDFQGANGRLKSLSQIMGILGNKMKGMSSAKKTNVMQQLFGRYGASAATILSDNAKQVGNLTGRVKDAVNNGYTSKTSQQNMQTTEGQLLRLKQSGNQLAKEYAEGLMPVFSKTADLAINLAKGLSHLPTGFKDIVAGATLVVPAIAGIAYIMATLRKTTSVYLGLKRNGLKWFYKTNDALKAGSNYYTEHSKNVDTDTQAMQKNNTQVQRAIELSNRLNNGLTKGTQSKESNTRANDQNTSSQQSNNAAANAGATANEKNTDNTTDNSSAKRANTQANDDNSKSEDDNSKSADTNATAQKTDTAATEANSAAKESGGEKSGIGNGGDTLNGLSIGEGGSAAKDAEDADKPSKIAALGGKVKGLVKGSGKLPIKGAAGTGLAIGGTEALSGNPKQGLEDGIGTAGGAIAGAPAGPVGEAIGGVIGPMITKKLGDAMGKSFNNARKKARKSPSSAGYTDDELAAHAKNMGTSYSNALKGMDGNTKNFVKAIGSDEQKARNNYLSHRGKMSKAQSGYYKDAVKNATNYGKSMENENKRSAKYALDHNKISKSEYNKELANDKRYYKKKSKTLNNDEKNLEKASTKGAGARKKALNKFNKDLMSMTNTSNKKQIALRRRLDNHKGALDEKSYKKTIREAKNNYRDSVNTAKKTYNTKKKAADDTYNKEVNHINGMKGLSADKRRSLIKNAQDQHDKTLDKADDQKEKSINKAKDQRDGVVKAADDSESSAVSDFQDIANKAENMLSGIGSAATKVKGWLSSHLGGGKGGKKVDPSTLWHGTDDTQALHFAGGILPGISKDENSVINDGSGRELVKLPNGQMVLPSGRNVHTVLPKGTSVFNAAQSRRLLSAVRKPAVHHAAGTVGSLGSESSGGSSKGRNSTVSVKTPNGNLDKTEVNTRKSMKNIHDLLTKGYKKTNKDASKELDKFHDHNSDSWDDTRDITKKHAKKIHNDTLDRYTDMKDSINDLQKRSNQLTDTHLDTTVSYFKHHFAMIPPISQSSMKSGISNINSGISAIDKVLAQFGGNSSVLGMVHYATGTSTPSMQKQLAVLNDATSGPRQEAVVSDSGKVRMPRGRNVPTLLNPGDKVLNGSDTLRALRTGLIPHYAGGLNSNDALKALAKRYAKAPTSFTDDTFNKLTTAVGSLLAKDTTTDAKNGAQKPANDWSNAMWKYIDSLINPDNSILVQKMHELGDGHPYKFGANGPKYWDCGSLVQHALMALGIPAPRTHFISAFPTIPQSEAGPGDIVESNTHVGVVDSDGAKSYFSAYNDTEQPNILSLPLNNTNFTGAGDPYHFLRVPQLEKYNSEDQEVKSNPLTPLVKKQLGSKASGWISSNLGDSAGTVSGNGSIARAWNELSKLGMSKTQIAAVIGGAKQEAGPDFSPTAYDPDGGLGLFQITPSASGVNLRTWASNRGEDWKDPAVQARCYYDTFLKPSGYTSTDGSLMHEAYEAASVEGHDRIDAGIPGNSNLSNRESGAREVMDWFNEHHGKGYHNGGLSMSDKMAHISEGNKPEMVLPLTNRSRAVELMLRSLQYMFGNDQSNSSKQNNNDQNQQSNDQAIRDRRFEQELIQSNRHKDKLINNILDKMTLLINTVRNKPVISKTDIYKANRSVGMQKMRLRNYNRGTF